jgi:hypothetical protein
METKKNRLDRRFKEGDTLSFWAPFGAALTQMKCVDHPIQESAKALGNITIAASSSGA